MAEVGNLTMDYDSMRRSAAVNFFIQNEEKQFALRRMFMVPRAGDSCVFKGVTYLVMGVQWCLDDDATGMGVRVNVQMSKV